MMEVKEGLAVWNWAAGYFIYINLLLSLMIVFFQRRDPKAVWTWLLILYFVPVFGFFFYLMFAQDYHKSRMFRIKEVEDRLKYGADRQTAEAVQGGRSRMCRKRRQNMAI